MDAAKQKKRRSCVAFIFYPIIPPPPGPGWDLSVLCSDPALLGQMRIPLDTSLGLVNGGINVRLGQGVVR